MYAGNDPSNLYDPAGLDAFKAFTFPCTVGTGEHTETVNCESYNLKPNLIGLSVPLWDDTHPQKPKPDVQKSYWSGIVPCSQDAKGVIGTIENNFASFGNYTTTVGGIGTGSVVFSPASGPISAGSSIPITVSVTNGVPIGSPQSMGVVLNTSVNVNFAGATAFQFSTVPGHLLYPATIGFSAQDAGSGNIMFNIDVQGNFPGIGNAAAFAAGGSVFEDNQWNRFLDQVKTLCGK